MDNKQKAAYVKQALKQMRNDQAYMGLIEGLRGEIANGRGANLNKVARLVNLAGHPDTTRELNRAIVAAVTVLQKLGYTSHGRQLPLDWPGDRQKWMCVYVLLGAAYNLIRTQGLGDDQ